MITIQNDRIKCSVSEYAAEPQSIVLDGVDFLWYGDPQFWGRRAPMLFPICGALKEEKYLYQGKEYTLPKHGFAKMLPFTVAEQKEDCVTFLLEANEETKKNYPFDFALYITFSLHDATLKTTYTVVNRDTQAPLYCNLGAHEAYLCPEGVDAYDIVFHGGAPTHKRMLQGSFLTTAEKPIEVQGDRLAMKTAYFAEDTLVFPYLKTRSVTFAKRDGGRSVTVDFPDFEHLLLWTVPGAPYLCIEPWNGLPDFVGTSYELTEKIGICKVEAGKTLTCVHQATFSMK